MEQPLILEIIQDTFDSLQRVGLLENRVIADDNTVLLGAGSPLDSIGFVTFITELEDRVVSQGNAPDFALVLSEIHDFNADAKHLTTGTLAKYIGHATGQTEAAEND